MMGPSRDDALLPAIAEVLRDAHISPRDVRAVACGSGPGSFTSLRIAASLAKGLASANGAALFAIPSLLLAAAVLNNKSGPYLLHADAMRGERYVVRVTIESDGEIVMSSPIRMTLDKVVAMAAREHAQLVAVGTVVGTRGCDAAAAGSATNTDNTAIVVQPHARNVVLLDSLFHTFGPVSLEAWEPDYGRLAEAQVKWETAHGRVLPAG